MSGDSLPDPTVVAYIIPGVLNNVIVDDDWSDHSTKWPSSGQSPEPSIEQDEVWVPLKLMPKNADALVALSLNRVCMAMLLSEIWFNDRAYPLFSCIIRE